MDYLLKGIGLVLLVGALPAEAQPSASASLVQGPIHFAFTPSSLQGEESTINQILVTPMGQIVAAGEQLLFYEDHQWHLVQKLRKPTIRRLLVDGNYLWLASPGELGRARLPLNSNSRYEPLDLPDLKNSGELWGLLKVGKFLVATGTQAVWFVRPGSREVSQVELPNGRRLGWHDWNGTYFISRPDGPIMRIGDGKLDQVENPLPDKSETIWLWSDPDFILTPRSLYAKQQGAFVPVLPTEVITRGSTVTTATRWGRYLAVGTITQGLALIDLSTFQVRFVTTQNGLSSPMANCFLVDSSNRLWIGTRRGIDVFEPLEIGQATTLREYPIKALRAGGLFVGFEDHAVYQSNLNGEGPVMLPRTYEFIPTHEGVALGLWSSVQFKGVDIPTPHNRVGAVIELPGIGLLATTAERVHLIDLSAKTAAQLPTQASEFSGFAIVADTLWGITVDGGLHRAELKLPLHFTLVTTAPMTGYTKLSTLGSTLVFASPDRVSFGEKFQTVANTAGIQRALMTKNDDGLWLAGEKDGERRLGQLVKQGDTVRWETVEAPGLAQLSEIHDMTGCNHELTICGDSTILELNTNQLKPAYRLSAPRLTFKYPDARSGAEITQPEPPAEIDADNNSLAFSGTVAFDEFGERPRLERRLLPTETTWMPTKLGEVVSYPSLSPRTYTLEVRTTHLGHTGAVAAHTFTVLPPWYATRTAALGYVACAALGFYGLYRLRTHNLRKRTAELERIVEERTHALKEASEAKTEFLASMSHEIRNPMNGVIGLVDILREQPAATPRQAETLRLLHHCADQLRSTVDDILDFSKIEAGRIALESATFDLRDTLEAAAVTIDQTGEKIVFLDKPPHGIALVGDVGKVRQIFANYLSNALKYGVPPGARVSTLVTNAVGGVRLTVGVASSGPTIPKDTLDKFFDTFTRGTDAVERNIHGTGLGLAICRKFAQAMGGEVGAVSANGETTFYLNVPFARAGEAAPASVPAAAPNALPAKALAIEDEDYNRIVLGSILAKMNYTVDWATTGAEALKLAQENGYDIILTDYRLPDTNGVELTKKILKFCPDPKPAVFAVTAYSTKERREECLGAGMAGFISKPITLEKLRTTLAGWGEKNLAKISLETSRLPAPVFTSQPPPEILAVWKQLIAAAGGDAKHAANLAHKLNNLCRAHGLIDAAEQLELLEGALERGEPSEPFLRASEEFLRG